MGKTTKTTKKGPAKRSPSKTKKTTTTKKAATSKPAPKPEPVPEAETAPELKTVQEPEVSEVPAPEPAAHKGKVRPRKRELPQFSQQISEFLNFLDSVQKEYSWNYERVGKMDSLTQDYLHKLELEVLDYKERAKVATAMTKCRQYRRDCKDIVCALEPLVVFLGTERGRTTVNQLREVLGRTRKAEERLEGRHYTPRVLDEEVIL